MVKGLNRKQQSDRSPSDRLFVEGLGGASITAIEPLASNPNLRRVRVGTKTVATLQAADIESLRFRVGQSWTAEAAQRVADAVSAAKARTTAMKLLGRRDFSRAELIDRLEARGHSRSTATSVADELVRNGWINDRDRAESIIRGTTRSKPASRRLLVARMVARGIETHVADQAAANARANASDLDDAISMARRTLDASRSVAAVTARRRIAAQLARRGFDEDVIGAALERVGLMSDDAASTSDGDDHS